MIKVLVDSDIIIDFLRTGEGLLPILIEGQRDSKYELYLSSITILELFAGQSSRKVAEKLKELIEGFHVISVGTDLAVRAGEIKRDYDTEGALADLIVGTSSVFVGAKLATRNKRHYTGIPKLQFYSPS